jgi:hypothetical protein
MTERITTLRLGTRGSALARWQTDYIAARLTAVWPGLVVEVAVLHTQGDRVLDKPLPLIGGKGSVHRRTGEPRCTAAPSTWPSTASRTCPPNCRPAS